MPTTDVPAAHRGTCRILFAFSVGRAIDLTVAEGTLVAARRMAFRHPGKFPTEAGVVAPIRLSWSVPPVDVLAGVTEPEVEVAAYAFGALVLTFTLPVEGTLDDLVQVSRALYAHDRLPDTAKATAEQVLGALGDAVTRPELEAEIEDYWTFDLEPVGEPGAIGPTVSDWYREHRGDLARVLRAAECPLSEQEIDDANASPVSYGVDDLVLVDWLGAILVGGNTGDERLVLELATVELLELRVLDARLDKETEASYRVLARPVGALFGWKYLERELEVVARAQAENALIHQGIDNALKLFGDDYLARLYRVAAARFHFDDWDTAIQRKLTVLERIYTSLDGRSSHRRSEALEWIIIILIAVDILLYFTPLR